MAASKGVLYEMFFDVCVLSQNITGRQRFILELTWHSRDRGDFVRQSRVRGEFRLHCRKRVEFKRMWQFKLLGDPMRNLLCKNRCVLKHKGLFVRHVNCFRLNVLHLTFRLRSGFLPD